MQNAKRVPQHLVQQAQAARREFFVEVPASTTLAEVLAPAYFVPVQRELQLKNTKIEVRREDGAFDVVLRVAKAGENGVYTEMLYGKVDDDKPLEAPDKAPLGSRLSGAAVQWAGPAVKFRIVDKAGVPIEGLDGFSTKSAALEAMRIAIEAEKEAA